MKTLTWTNCYDSNWNGLITPESYAHPAKMARGLLDRILDHALARGWFSKGQVVGDPFGGIGSTGIMCSYRGLRSVSVELEPRFVGFAQANFDLHRHKWDRLQVPHPVMIRGDSRNFAELVQCSGVVTSPPYAETIQSGQDFESARKRKAERFARGEFQCKRPDVFSSEKNNGAKGMFHSDYGTTPGQIGQLKAGTVQGVVGSPPYSDTKIVAAAAGGIGLQYRLGNRPKGAASDCIQGYGNSSGNIGNAEDYWQAVAQVYRSCCEALCPGGVIILVVKDYVSKGKRVRLCDDTMSLLAHIGFTPMERIRAMLVHETVEAGLFGDEKTVKAKKSFFRRLYEQDLPEQDERRIDWEEVLISRKPTRNLLKILS